VAERTIADAEKEITITFEAAGASVQWIACRDVAKAIGLYGDSLFVIRLRNDKAPFKAGNVSLDTMGRAYTEQRRSGYVADVYIPSVRKFGEERDIEFATLLGLVMCHELGHLILGPGHTNDGLMFGKWNWKQTEAGKKRWLRFSQSQGQDIVSELKKRSKF
jgi:hypothetical protein